MPKKKHDHEFKPKENGRSLFSRSLICQVCACGKERWFVGGQWNYMLQKRSQRIEHPTTDPR